MDQITLSLLGPGRCPPETARALKAVDEDAVLLHLGGQKWWLGVEAPNPKAEEIVRSGKLRRQLEKPPEAHAMDPAEQAVVAVELEKEYTMYQIMAGGFRPIALYDLSEEDWTFGAIVEDFRIRDHHWKNQSGYEHELEVRQSVSMEELNKSRVAMAAERMKDAAREAYNFVFRGRRSVGGGRLPQNKPGGGHRGLARAILNAEE